MIKPHYFHSNNQSSHKDALLELHKEMVELERDRRKEVFGRIELEQKLAEMRRKLEKFELQRRIAELQSDGVRIVEEGSAKCKNLVIEETQQMLNKLKATKASDEGSFANLLAWAGSYLSDNFPQTPTAIVFYVSAINWSDSYVTGTECDLTYQAARWLLLFITLGYLTFMGFRTSTAPSVLEFVKTFWVHWVVFIFMMMAVMALPPVGCYGESLENIMNIAGVCGLITMALCLYSINWNSSRYVPVLDFLWTLNKLCFTVSSESNTEYAPVNEESEPEFRSDSEV